MADIHCNDFLVEMMNRGFKPVSPNDEEPGCPCCQVPRHMCQEMLTKHLDPYGRGGCYEALGFSGYFEKQNYKNYKVMEYEEWRKASIEAELAFAHKCIEQGMSQMDIIITAAHFFAIAAIIGLDKDKLSIAKPMVIDLVGSAYDMVAMDYPLFEHALKEELENVSKS